MNQTDPYLRHHKKWLVFALLTAIILPILVPYLLVRFEIL